MTHLKAAIFIIISMILIWSGYEKITNNKVTIGFFSPGHIDKFASHVSRSIINVYPTNHKGKLQVNLDAVRMNLEYVKEYDHRINLDLGLVITDVKPVKELKTQYIKRNGKLGGKIFSPLKNNKIRLLVSNDELARRLHGLPKLLKQYRNNVGLILLVDEPYLNGIPPEEIDRVVRKLKQIFTENGVVDLEYGVIFASALFNADYARFINKQMAGYVDDIDHYFEQHQHKNSKQFQEWVDVIKQIRLTTYDTVNNMYIGGGIPKQLDVIGFDFYLSTTLFDMVHNNTLQYFAEQNSDDCSLFKNKTVSTIKDKLSFISNEPSIRNIAASLSDKKILDAIFQCRMSSAMKLLANELVSLDKRPKVIMVGESSANGLLEYDKKGIIKKDQPHSLVEERILDEVQRSYQFYLDKQSFFDAGLYYFLYSGSYDSSINLLINGAESAKSVIDFLYHISKKPTASVKDPAELMPYNEWQNNQSQHYKRTLQLGNVKFLGRRSFTTTSISDITPAMDSNFNFSIPVIKYKGQNFNTNFTYVGQSSEGKPMWQLESFGIHYKAQEN